MARPYIWRLNIFRLTWPSTLPELHRSVSLGGDGVLVGARAGDKGLQGWLPGRGGGCHPLLELAAAAAGHERGEGADVRANGC